MLKSVKTYFRLLAEDQLKGKVADFFRVLTLAASWIYVGVAIGRRKLYERGWLKTKKLPMPVISVGNLTWGGSGKTPLVEYLAQKMIDMKKMPMVLTRGYGKDETAQLRNHLPQVAIGIGKNRYQTALELQKTRPCQAAILDDGLQHLPLERDMEIVVINALAPFGNRHYIPRGILREPLSVLKKANVAVLSHVNLVDSKRLKYLRRAVRAISPGCHILEAYLEPLFFYRPQKNKRVSVQKLEGQKVTTFSAVASPRSFQLLLSQQGIRPSRNFEFTDHHPFTRKELMEIKRVSDSASIEEIVTTEKDYFRAPELISEIVNPLVLATRTQIISGEDYLVARFSQILGARI